MLNTPAYVRDEPVTRKRSFPGFQNNLQDAMRRKNMTQADVARALSEGATRRDRRGYDQPIGKDRISAWATGRVMPSTENLQKLAEILDTTPAELLGVEQQTGSLDGLRIATMPNGDFHFDALILPPEDAADVLALIARRKKKTDGA